MTSNEGRLGAKGRWQAMSGFMRVVSHRAAALRPTSTAWLEDLARELKPSRGRVSASISGDNQISYKNKEGVIDSGGKVVIALMALCVEADAALARGDVGGAKAVLAKRPNVSAATSTIVDGTSATVVMLSQIIEQVDTELDHGRADEARGWVHQARRLGERWCETR